MLSKEQKKMLEQVNKRIMLVGKFTCNKETRILNFKESNTDKTQNNKGKLSREDFFRILKPEVVSFDDNFKYLGNEVWFNYYYFGRPFDNQGGMNSFSIPHDSVLLDRKGHFFGSKIASIQKTGLEVFEKLVKNLDFLSQFYHPNFGRSLLSLAKEYIYKHANLDKIDEVRLNDWKWAIESDPELNKLVIRYLTCYSADESQCLKAFRKRLKSGPAFKSKIEDGQSTLKGNQADILANALVACKKALCSYDISDDIYQELKTVKGLEWLENYDSDIQFGINVKNIDQERKVDNASFHAYYQAFWNISASVHRFIRSRALHPYIFAGLMSKYVATDNEADGIQQIATKAWQLSVDREGRKVVAGVKERKKHLECLRKNAVVKEEYMEKLKAALEDDVNIFDDQVDIVLDSTIKPLIPSRSFTPDNLKGICTELFTQLGLLTGGPILDMHEKNQKIVERLSQYYHLILSSTSKKFEDLKNELRNNITDNDEFNETEFIKEIFDKVIIVEEQDAKAIQDSVMDAYLAQYGYECVNDFAKRVLDDIDTFKNSIKTLKRIYAANLENEVSSKEKNETGSAMQSGAGISIWTDEQFKRLRAEAERERNKQQENQGQKKEAEYNAVLNIRHKHYNQSIKEQAKKEQSNTFTATKAFWDELKNSGFDQEQVTRAQELAAIEINVKIVDDGEEEDFGKIILSGNKIKKKVNLDGRDNLIFEVDGKEINFEPGTFDDEALEIEEIWRTLENAGVDISEAKENPYPKSVKINVRQGDKNIGEINACGDKVEIKGNFIDHDNLIFSIDEQEITINLDVINDLIGGTREKHNSDYRYDDFRELTEIQKKIHATYNDDDHTAKDRIRPYLRALIFGEYLLATPKEQSKLGEMDTSINLGIIQRMLQYFGVLDKKKAEIFTYGIDSDKSDNVNQLLRKIKLDELIRLPKNINSVTGIDDAAVETLVDYIQYQYSLAKSLSNIEVYLKELNEIGDFFDAIQNTDLEVVVMDGTLNQHSKEVTRDLKKFFACEKPPLFVYLTRQSADEKDNIDINTYLTTWGNIAQLPADRHPNLQIPILVTPFDFNNTQCPILTNDTQEIPLPKLVTGESCDLDQLIVDKLIQEHPYLLLCASLMKNNANFGNIKEPNDGALKEPWYTQTIKILPQQGDAIISLLGEAWFRNDYLADTLVLSKVINLIRLLRVNDVKAGNASTLTALLKQVDTNDFISTLEGLDTSFKNINPSFYIFAANNLLLFSMIESGQMLNLSNGMEWERSAGSGKRTFSNQRWLSWTMLIDLLS
ncbi:MAG: hypothetical protein HQK65_01020 [Desulfamplus sp.]|nr:hypothetical protein [Desulfamplus sp.]